MKSLYGVELSLVSILLGYTPYDDASYFGLPSILLVTRLLGLTAGAVLGMLVGDKDKKRVQEALNNQMKQLRKKYEDLSQEGIVKEGIDK